MHYILVISGPVTLSVICIPVTFIYTNDRHRGKYCDYIYCFLGEMKQRRYKMFFAK